MDSNSIDELLTMLCAMAHSVLISNFVVKVCEILQVAHWSMIHHSASAN